jgi:hypothetical protein
LSPEALAQLEALRSTLPDVAAVDVPEDRPSSSAATGGGFLSPYARRKQRSEWAIITEALDREGESQALLDRLHSLPQRRGQKLAQFVLAGGRLKTPLMAERRP